MNKISDEKRNRIIELLSAGRSYRYIVREVGVSKNAIRAIVHGRVIYKSKSVSATQKGHGHDLQTQPRGKENPYGYTQYENWKRNDAIWQFIYDLLPTRPMKRTEVIDLVIPRWPEKKRFGVGKILSNLSRGYGYKQYIILEPVRIKHCAWCGKDILIDRRWRHCSSECEKAEKAERQRERIRRKVPIWEPITLLCKEFHSTEHDCLSHLAFDVVKTETDGYSPQLIASAWIGIREAWDAGERNRPDLIAAAQAELKKFKRVDWASHLSIDAMKESVDYEPHIIGYEALDVSPPRAEAGRA